MQRQAAQAAPVQRLALARVLCQHLAALGYGLRRPLQRQQAGRQVQLACPAQVARLRCRIACRSREEIATVITVGCPASSFPVVPV